MILFSKQVTSLAIATAIAATPLGASAEFGGQCVRYVKNQRPGGYLWDKTYPMKVNNAPTTSKSAWVSAKDIWTSLWVSQRGISPKPNSVMVLDAFAGNPYGHVAIVTATQGNKIFVRHSNWCANNCQQVSTGFYTNVGGGRVTYNGGRVQYPLLGYVYAP